MEFKCPHCNRIITLNVDAPDKKCKRGRMFESTQKLYNAAAAVTHPPASYREIPSSLPNRESHVVVPLAQALISGVFLAPVGAIALGVIARYGNLEAWAVVEMGCIGGLGTFLLVTTSQWFGRLHGYNALLWRIEETANIDINQDGEIGRPEPKEEIQLSIAHTNDSGKVVKTTRPTLSGVTDEAWAAWCHQVSQGIMDISEVNWIGPGKPFSKTAYRGMLERLSQNGIITKDGNAKNSKWTVTHGGRSALLHWAREAELRGQVRQTDKQTDKFDFIES